jgi:hypothetical protein
MDLKHTGVALTPSGKSSYLCEPCDTGFSSMTFLRAHTVRVHNKEYTAYVPQKRRKMLEKPCEEVEVANVEKPEECSGVEKKQEEDTKPWTEEEFAFALDGLPLYYMRAFVLHLLARSHQALSSSLHKTDDPFVN